MEKPKGRTTKPIAQHPKKHMAPNAKNIAKSSGKTGVPKPQETKKIVEKTVAPSSPGWVKTNSNKELVKISGKVVSFNPPKSISPPSGIVVWMGQDKKAINSGEHFWLFRIISGHTVQFGFVTPDKLVEDYGVMDIRYCRHVILRDKYILKHYGPWTKAGNSVGLLLSFTEDRIRIYFYCDGNCLGLAFNVFKHCFPDGLLPAVLFYMCSGSAEMLQYAKPGDPEFPQLRDRIPHAEQDPGIFGIWLAVENSIKIDGVPFKFPVWGIRLRISTEWTDLASGRYTVRLFANSTTWFDILWRGPTDKKWEVVQGTQNYKMAEPPEMPADWDHPTLKERRDLMMWGYGIPPSKTSIKENKNWIELEKRMKDWVVHPDQVVFSGHSGLTIKKGESEVTFNRPGIFEGDIKDAVNIYEDYVE